MEHHIDSTPITHSSDPRLQGIPSTFSVNGGLTLGEIAKTNKQWTEYQNIYMEWNRQNQWKPPKKTAPKASYMPPTMYNDVGGGGEYSINDIQRVEDESIKQDALEPISRMPTVQVQETKEEKRKRELLERYPLFNPEIHAKKFEELYPDLQDTRDRALGKLVSLRKEFENLEPRFARLMNNSNVILNSYVNDILEHMRYVVSDYDILREEIMKAHKQLENVSLEKQEKRYNIFNPEGKNWFQKLGDVFSLMSGSFDADEIELDQHELELRKKIRLTETIHIKETEEEMSKLFIELQDTGLMDILNKVKADGTAYLSGISEYETKKKNLYAKMIKHVAERDKSERILLQEGILNFQDWIIQDLRNNQALETEFSLFKKALSHVVGFKPRKMSKEEFEKHVQTVTESVKQAQTKNEKSAKDLLDVYNMNYLEKSKKHGMFGMLKYIMGNEDYPGNFKRKYQEAVDSYQERMKRVYEPNIFEKAYAGISEFGNTLMEMIPDVLASIPAMSKMHYGATKTAQLIGIVINNAATRCVAEKVAVPILKKLWDHKIILIQILMGADILTVTGSMGLMMLLKFSDMWLLRLLNKGLEYIPGYDPVYLNGAIGFASSTQEERWKYIQDAARALESGSKGATHSVFAGLRKYLPLAFRINQTSELTNLIKSGAYRDLRRSDLVILDKLANMENRGELARYNPGNLPAPKKSIYNTGELNTEAGIKEISENLLYHLIRHNQSQFKNPKDVYEMAFGANNRFSGALFDTSISKNSLNTHYETGYKYLDGIMKDSKESAEIETKAVLQGLFNKEGTPTVDEIKKLISGYTGDYQKFYKEQLALETIVEDSARMGDMKKANQSEKVLLQAIRNKYKTLHKLNFFKELGVVSKNNHDTISQLSQLSTVFATEHRDLNRLIDPNAPNARAQLEELMTSETSNAWQFRNILSTLHGNSIDGDGTHDYSQIASMIAQQSDKMDREGNNVRDYSIFNISKMAGATSQRGFLTDLENTKATGIVSATVNFSSNMFRLLVDSGLNLAVGGPAVAASGFVSHVAPLVMTTGLWMTAVSLPFVNEGVRSMLFTHLFSNQVLVPLVEWFSGETYSQMIDQSEKYKKASFDLDTKIADSLLTNKKRWELDRKKKLQAARERRDKYSRGLERASRTFKYTVDRYHQKAPTDKIKKIQAAESRMVSEEIQYSQLLEETDLEIERLENEKYEAPEKDDLIPGYSSLIKEYQREVNSRSTSLKLLNHISSIPQYIQWMTIGSSVYNILSDPWKYGKYKDSTGKENWKFPGPIAQLESAYEGMDDALGVNQTTENALYEVYEDAGDVKVPPSAFEFEFGKGQHQIDNIQDAIGVLDESYDAGVKFIDDNYVLVDVSTGRPYEKPAGVIEYYLDLVRSSLREGESTTVNLTDEFNLIPDTRYTRSLADTGYTTDKRSIFDDGVNWSTAIDDVKVRLLPKVLFEGNPKTGIPLPEQSSALYQSLLEPYEERKYGNVFDVVLSRLDQSELQFRVKRQIGPVYAPDQTLDDIFPEFQDIMFVRQEGSVNTEFKRKANDPSWFLDRIFGKVGTTNKNNIAMTGIKEGAPYTEKELAGMSVFDIQLFGRVLSELYGDDVFSTPGGIRAMANYIGERTVYDLVSQINRRNALAKADAFTYGYAWLRFCTNWFYTGLEYRASAFKDVFFNVIPYGISAFFGAEMHESTEAKIKKLEILKSLLIQATKDATGVVKGSLKQSQHMSLHRGTIGTLETDPRLKQVQTINTAYEAMKDKKGVVHFQYGFMSRPLTEVDDSTPLEWYIDNLRAKAFTTEEELAKEAQNYNDYLFMKIFNALGHDLLARMVTTTKIYLEGHAKITNAIDPIGKALEWKTGIPSRYREPVFAKFGRGVTALAYFGLNSIMTYSGVAWSDTLEELDYRWQKKGPLDVLHEDIPAYVPGEGVKIAPASKYEEYDLSEILKKTPTDHFVEFNKRMIEMGFNFVIGVSTLNPNNPLIGTVGSAFNFGYTAAVKTAAFASNVGNAIIYAASWVGFKPELDPIEAEKLKEIEEQNFNYMSTSYLHNAVLGLARTWGGTTHMSHREMDAMKIFFSSKQNENTSINPAYYGLTLDQIITSNDPLMMLLAKRINGPPIMIK